MRRIKDSFTRLTLKKCCACHQSQWLRSRRSLIKLITKLWIMIWATDLQDLWGALINCGRTTSHLTKMLSSSGQTMRGVKNLNKSRMTYRTMTRFIRTGLPKSFLKRQWVFSRESSRLSPAQSSSIRNYPRSRCKKTNSKMRTRSLLRASTKADTTKEWLNQLHTWTTKSKQIQ